MFITFEGCDGVGKTTQAKLFVEYLKSREEYKDREIILCREPGGTETGQQIRELFLNNADKSERLTQVLLLLAAKSELLTKVVLPNLEKGNIVVCDRYTDSLFAYQGQVDNNKVPNFSSNVPSTIIDYEMVETITGLIKSSRILSTAPDITFILTAVQSFVEKNIEKRNLNNSFDLKPNIFHKRVNYILLGSGSSNDIFPFRKSFFIHNNGSKTESMVLKEIIKCFDDDNDFYDSHY